MYHILSIATSLEKSHKMPTYKEDETFGGRPVLVPIQVIHEDLRDIERQILKTQHVFQASETLINGFNHYSKLVGLDPDGEVHSDTLGTLEFVKAQARTLVENYQSARRRLEILVNQASPKYDSIPA
jgi:hypothetical protein